MNLSNHKKCDKCGKVYDTSSFANMCGNGELNYSQIEIYGDKYDLCPKCTHEIYRLIKETEVQNANAFSPLKTLATGKGYVPRSDGRTIRKIYFKEVEEWQTGTK